MATNFLAHWKPSTVEGLAEDHRLQIINAAYLRAIEIIKSNAPEVERLAGHLIKQRRVREARLNEVVQQETAAQVRRAEKVAAANMVPFSVLPISWRGSVNAGHYIRLRHFARPVANQHDVRTTPLYRP